MGSVELKYSKSRVDKAGETLKKKDLSGKEFRESLEVISNWRAYHVKPLNAFVTTLRRRANLISRRPDIMVMQRLKRVPSILLKLKTHKTMRLSAMQDIGGLRVIFNEVEYVNRLVERYRASKDRNELFSTDDYIAVPKKDGYRSVHLVYKLKRNPDIFIEIQIRSYYQHIWATAVEVFGTLKNSSFKSGHGEKEWLDFFKLLSSVFAHKEGTVPVEEHRKMSKRELLNSIKKKIDDLKAIENLSTYTSVYEIVSEKTKGTGRKGIYFLIVLNSHDYTISIKRFTLEKLDEAVEAYVTIEKKFYNDIGVNVVLVNPGDAKKLRTSYPNYFMDTQALVRHLSEIMMDQFL